MKKRVLAPALAIAIAAGSVVAVGNADAQEFTAAELYEPRIGGTSDLGPDEKFALLFHDAGPRVVSADLNLFESPYPGLEIRRDTSANPFPDVIYVKLEGGKIYPERFDVLTGVTVHYDDGSSEYVEGSFTVRPLKALVAGQPAEPIEPTTTPRATVSVTATTTVTEFYPEPYPDPYPVYETETVTNTQTDTETVTELYPEPYPDPYPVYETETVTNTQTDTETVTTTTTEYVPEPYPEVSYETETVTVTATKTVEPTMTTTSTVASEPTQSPNGELTHADIYTPEISPLGGYEIGPSESYAYLISGAGPEFDDVEVLEFDSPYPMSYSLAPKNDLINHRTWITAAVEPKKIYPAEFKVKVTARVTYKDGSSEEVSGLLPIRPVKTLVTDNPVPSKAPATSASQQPSTVTVTRKVEVPGDVVTVTATAEPLPPQTVTTTATQTEKVEIKGDGSTVTSTQKAPAPKTVTATVTHVQQVEVPGDPVTVTATAAANPVTVTETPTPETVVATETATVVETVKETVKSTATATATATVTKTASAQAAESGSSLSTGGIIGIVLAVLAALGAGAFALSGGLPPEIAKALPF